VGSASATSRDDRGPNYTDISRRERRHELTVSGDPTMIQFNGRLSEQVRSPCLMQPGCEGDISAVWNVVRFQIKKFNVDGLAERR
jgi:hypothetical protein